MPLIRCARNLNDEMASYYVSKFKLPEKSTVMVIGISYRERVKEIAYSRTFEVVKLLLEMGHNVVVFDPLYSKEETEDMGLNYSNEFEEVDGIIIMNKYPELLNELKNFSGELIDVKGTFR